MTSGGSYQVLVLLLRHFLLLLFLQPAFAQPGEPHRGIVRSAGKPIPGASVIATWGGRKFVTSTDEQGAYEFRDLAPGTWTMVVEIFGFRIPQRDVLVGGRRPVEEWDLELEERIAATAHEEDTPQLEFQTVDIPPPEPDHLPAPPAAPPPDDPVSNDAFLISGSLSQGLQAPPLEEEALPVPLVAALPLSEVRPEPAAIKAPGLKSGRAAAKAPKTPARKPVRSANFGNRRAKKKADVIKGSAYWRFRDSALDARPYSINGSLLPKPDYAQHRFGLSAGGPLKIPFLFSGERSFFFLNYDGALARNPFHAVATLPTPLERAGDFSQSITRSPVTIYDILSRQPFPGNVVPQSRINPIATGLLDFIPLPNFQARVQNYQFVASYPQNTHTLGFRLNQSLTRRSRLSVSYNFQFRDSEHVQPFGFRDTSSGRNHNFQATWTRNLSARVVNNTKFAFTRNSLDSLPYFAHGPDVAGDLGIQGTSRDPANFGPPNLSFTNFGDLSDGVPLYRLNGSWGIAESLSWVRGRHTIGLGGEFRRMLLDNSSDPSGRGNFSFSGLLTSGLDSVGQPVGNTGFDFADFLLGFPQSSNVRFGLRDTFFRAMNYSGFVNDDFRARPNLTLTLGLRYEYYSPLAEKFGHLSNLDIAPDFTGASRVTPAVPGLYSGLFPSSLIEPDRNNFAPRLGLAWKPGRRAKLQVRAGYSWFYNGSVYGSFAPRLATQPPFAQTGVRSTSILNPLTLAEGFSTAATSDRITNTYAVDRSYLVGYAQTWNLAVQKELPQALVIELGYLGTKGTRLDLQRQPNRAAPGSPLTAEERRRIGNAVGFTWDSSEGNSIYHAGQLRVTRRFRAGLSANALYTFSKSIDNASNMGGGGNVVAQNDRDLRSERGLSTFNRTHSLNLNLFYASLAGARGSRLRAESLAGRLLAGWSLSGGITMLSGPPLTARVLGNRADSGGTGVVGSGRADATGLPIQGDPFFNLAAFGLPPSGRFGNAGRNTVPGPGLFSINAALGRTFRLSEKRRLEFRIESANLTNHVNLTGIGTIVNASNYGMPLNAGPMRSLTGSVRFRF